MLYLVDYDKGESRKLANLLEVQKIEFKISSVESELIKATKIVLPDLKNIKKTLRQLQLSNLFSVLKMLDKPILGINGGMILLCEKIDTHCGLGKLPVTAEKIINEELKIEMNKYFAFSQGDFICCEYLVSPNNYTVNSTKIADISVVTELKHDDSYGMIINIEEPSDQSILRLKNIIRS